MQSILKTPTSFSEYAESRPSTKIVSFQVFLGGKPSKCEKNFLVIESYGAVHGQLENKWINLRYYFRQINSVI